MMLLQAWIWMHADLSLPLSSGIYYDDDDGGGGGGGADAGGDSASAVYGCRWSRIIHWSMRYIGSRRPGDNIEDSRDCDDSGDSLRVSERKPQRSEKRKSPPKHK